MQFGENYQQGVHTAILLKMMPFQWLLHVSYSSQWLKQDTQKSATRSETMVQCKPRQQAYMTADKDILRL